MKIDLIDDNSILTLVMSVAPFSLANTLVLRCLRVRITERQVQDYILYVRDDLGIAKGTFAPLFAGLKFFYVNTLGYDWALLTKKKFASHAKSGCPMSAAMRIAAA